MPALVGGYSLMGAAVGALGLGSLADKIGRKYTILGCFTLFCVVMFLTGFTNSPVLFGVCRVLTGFGIGGTMPNIVALASEYIPLQNRAWGIAALSSGMPLGSCVGPAIGMWLLPLYGWRSVYFVGVLPILLLPLVIKLHPGVTDPTDQKEPNCQAEGLLPQGVSDSRLCRRTLRLRSARLPAARAPIIELFREHRGLSTVLFWLTYFMFVLPGLWHGSLDAENDDE